jgi:uncharacterized protein
VKQRSLLDILRDRRQAILALGVQYGARHMRVFGSVARREERPDSDVDFLVEFPRGYDLFAQRLPLIERLSGLIGRRVEVVPEHELSRHIRSRVLQEAVEL